MKLNIYNIDSFKIEDLTGRKFECECGRDHEIGVKSIIIENGAIKKIPEVLNSLGFKNVLLAADVNTYGAAGRNIEQILNDNGFMYEKLIFKRDGNLEPDERAVGEMLVNIKDGTDVILAVGSGVINDISKFVSSRTDIPYIIAATAPSMDGFVSNVSPLITDNMKVTYEATTPSAVIGDVDILKNAPMEMILAGLGDVLGKYSSLNDWKLSNIINGEYYCDVIVKIVKNSIQKCIENIDGYRSRNDEAIKNLMESLVLSGIAMSFAGNSRPASGAEHHLAHFWEMMFLFDSKEPVLHGTKVGITTILVTRMREMLSNGIPDFKWAGEDAALFNQDEWRQNITRIYKKAADSVITQNENSDRNSIEKRLQRIDVIRDKWELIAKTLKETPSSSDIEILLKKAGAPSSPNEIGIDEETVLNSLLYGREVRTRYTILQLLWDLGLLSQFAEKINGVYFKKA